MSKLALPQKEQLQSNYTLVNYMLSVCKKYELYQLFEDLNEIPFENHDQVRINLLINYYLKIRKPDIITEIVLKLPNDYQGNKIKGGLLIDHYCKQNNLEKSIQLYNKMNAFGIEFISSTYTSIIKCYSENKKYREALKYFDSIRHNKQMTGLLITYNCALNVYTFYQNSLEAEVLFEEIDA